jgi:hypothetical protein
MGIVVLLFVLLSTNILVQNVRVLLGESCLKHQFLEQQDRAPIPRAAGNVSAHFSQRALLPKVAALLALGGSREVPLPGFFTSENEEPRLPSQAEILLRERTPAEVRERAKVAASKRQRWKAFLRLRRAARAEGRQHLEEHARSLKAEVAASNRQRRMALLRSRRGARTLGTASAAPGRAPK